jgi:hypothetical protein
MTDDIPISAMQLLLRPLSKEMSLELATRLADVQADAETQSRYDCLADGRSSGTLSPLEDAELREMVRANTLMGLLKAEARAVLSGPQPS